VARAAGASDFGIFDVPIGGTATLENLTIRNGAAPPFPYNSGGGIHNAGTLTVRNSTLTGNTGNRGGGIYNQSGALTVRYSTVTGNSSPASYGEGIHTFTTGSVTLDDVPLGVGGCGTTTTDQRGVTRPQNHACDVGAFEVGKGKTTSGRKP
jgi:hypothetical protein